MTGSQNKQIIANKPRIVPMQMFTLSFKCNDHRAVALLALQHLHLKSRAHKKPFNQLSCLEVRKKKRSNLPYLAYLASMLRVLLEVLALMWTACERWLLTQGQWSPLHLFWESSIASGTLPDTSCVRACACHYGSRGPPSWRTRLFFFFRGLPVLTQRLLAAVINTAVS